MCGRSIEVSHLVMYLLWGLAVLLLAGAWVTYAVLSAHGLSQLFGFTACIVAAKAAVCHVGILVAEAARVVIVSQEGVPNVRAMR